MARIALILLLMFAGCRTVEPVTIYRTIEVPVPYPVQPDTMLIEPPPRQLVAQIDSTLTPAEYVAKVNQALAQYIIWAEYVLRLPLPIKTLPAHEIPTGRPSLLGDGTPLPRPNP